ncbi:MAG TPA: redox-sensitive transcriptional activator SoxR [Ilumatobacter sp.]|nr:redox-sensitive transcriptional activator SoxR [Ilumatobacter sp.]
MAEPRRLTIGEVATRAGVATSALRFYEDAGLISSERNPSGHRVYHADVLRRVSFVRIAQRVGLSLDEIRAALAGLPERRTPTASDWARLAREWRPRLDDQIAVLTRLRDSLDGCIGCGCLSLSVCRIWNPGDTAGELGAGARYLLSDDRPDGLGAPGHVETHRAD